MLLIHFLTLRNPFNVKEPLGFKENNDHGFLLRPAHLFVFGPGGGLVLQLDTLTFAFRVIGEHPTFIHSGNLNETLSSSRMSLQHSIRNCLLSLKRIIGTNLVEILWSFRSSVRTLSSLPVLITSASDIILTLTKLFRSLTFALPQCFPPYVRFSVLQIVVHLQTVHFLQKLG